MRTYLVVIDDSDAARVALRFAARRALKTEGKIEILAVVEPQDFVQWGGVQAAIEEEQRLRIEGKVAIALGEIVDLQQVKPSISILPGEATEVVHDYLGARDDIAALVLAAAPSGDPGPLVTHFAGPECGKLPIPLMIVPGGLDDAAIERLS